MKESLKETLKKVTSDTDWCGTIYYTVSVGRNLVGGLIFTIAALLLGWFGITMLRSGYVMESLLIAIMFASAFYAGPVQVYRLIRELAARMKRYRDNER